MALLGLCTLFCLCNLDGLNLGHRFLRCIRVG